MAIIQEIPDDQPSTRAEERMPRHRVPPVVDVPESSRASQPPWRQIMPLPLHDYGAFGPSSTQPPFSYPAPLAYPGGTMPLHYPRPPAGHGRVPPMPHFRAAPLDLDHPPSPPGLPRRSSRVAGANCARPKLQNTPGASTSRRSRKPSTSPRAVMARRQAELAAGGRAEVTAGPSGKRMRAPDEDEGSPQKKARKRKTRDMNADEGAAFEHDRPVRKDDVFDEGSSIMVEERITPADEDEVGWDADSDAPAVGSPAKFDESWSPQSLGNASAGPVDGSSSPVVTAERLLQRAQGMEGDYEDELVDEDEMPRPITERIPGPPLVMPWEAVSPVASAGDLDDEERSVGWPNGTQYADEEQVIRPLEGVHGPFDDIYAEEYGATNAAPEEDEGEYFEYEMEPFEREHDVETGRARPSNREETRTGNVKPRFLLSPLIAPNNLPPPLVFEEHLEQPIPTPLKTDNPRKFHALFPDQEPTSPGGLLRQLRLTQAEVGRLELIEVRWEHAFHEALKEMGRQSVQLRDREEKMAEQEEKLREQEDRMREQEEKMHEQEVRMQSQAQAMAENEMVAQGAQAVQQQKAEELAQLHQLVDKLLDTVVKTEREKYEEVKKKTEEVKKKTEEVKKKAEELEEMKREKEEIERDKEGMRRLLEETRRERDEARQQIAAMTTGNTKRKGSPCEDKERDSSEQETCRSPKKLRGSPTQAKLVYHGPLRVRPTEA